jgi:aldose 1-epimerase
MMLLRAPSLGTFCIELERLAILSAQIHGGCPSMPERIMDVHTLANSHGVTVRFLPIGGAIVAIETPDREGRFDNVVLSFRDRAAYQTQRVYFGVICGRYANRIAQARFDLDGVAYRLQPTDGTSSVHGGGRGFDKAIWSVERPDGLTALLRQVSPEVDEGYPGALSVEVEYRLSEDDSFTIDYRATTDRPTIVNLTNHSYFNLAGSGDVLDHRLMVRAARYTPSDAELIPTGAVAPVAGTPFDFREAQPIGSRIRTPHPQMIAGRGYDVNYVVDRDAAGLVPAAHLFDPRSGRALHVDTTEVGLQLYTGNLLDGTLAGPDGLYRQSDGVCLEPHHFPNSPNTPAFPSTVLRPGETYRSTSVYRFTCEAG